MAKKAVKAKGRVVKRSAPAMRRASKRPARAKEGDMAEGERLIPPADGVTIRIYRIGHGDCHLLAFPGKIADAPVYVLIDCGYKPGSPGKLKNPTNAREICADIRAATGGHIHVAVITHEHQDHVNGISDKNFEGITIGEAWFAWTEDPTDDVAKRLRRVYKDKLLGLINARNRLAADSPDAAARVDDFLAFELGGDDERFDAQAALAMFGADGGSMNKKSMKVFKDRAQEGVRFLRPHEKIGKLSGTDDVRVFSLGPPREGELLTTLDPEGEEEFHALAFGASAATFFAMAAAGQNTSPFAGRYCIAKDAAVGDRDHGGFFAKFYGSSTTPVAPSPSGHDDQAPLNPEWRRIDNEWLLSAEQMALDMNDYTNNGSLVLAFELGKGGKVLLFPADAQRGNWLSWSKDDWKDGREVITAKDLLSRTVFYKVGHHGSHNATLNGKVRDDYPNLAWMGQGEYGREFTAMITAVRAWAETQKGWNHPLPAIKKALLEKASGRVFQTDTEFDDMKRFEGSPQSEWDAFVARTRGERLYFDYTIAF
jgi:glyoxylase-like metal-dependent hydrolase (beta-lactamase superfamily II)